MRRQSCTQTLILVVEEIIISKHIDCNKWIYCHDHKDVDDIQELPTLKHKTSQLIRLLNPLLIHTTGIEHVYTSRTYQRLLFVL